MRIISLLILALLSLACQYPPDCPPNPCDGNGDGIVTFDDGIAADWNEDGWVDLDDMQAWRPVCFKLIVE